MSSLDLGTADQVKRTAEDVESDDPGSKLRAQERAEQENLHDPSSWWFASTACPLLAGTFGPMANGFSICALVYSWRVYIPPGSSEQFGSRIQDPGWLVAVNVVSLVCAVIGNATLLLNMSRRLRFSIAQPITITGFLMAGVLLIADMAALASSPDYFLTDPREIPNEFHALTSAFYYAGFAAALYIVIGLLMCITVYGANMGYYDKDFNLTPSQRTLMLQTMSFIAYILLGALVFSTVEGWNYLDGVYWADVTLLTVGLGDYSPVTNVGRGLLFPYAICGILIVGLVVGSIRSLVLERGREKMSARIIEKRRETAVNNVDQHKQTIKISWFARAEFSTDPALSSAQRREEEFNVMRKVQRAAEREREYFSLGASMITALLLWFVGAVVFMAAEKDQQWSYFMSLYFTFTSLLTIGYGDYAPASNFGRAFFVFWSLLAVPSLTILISNMGDTIVKWFSDVTIWVASLTVLPGEDGVRVTFTKLMQQLAHRSQNTRIKFTPPGILGDMPSGTVARISSTDHAELLMDRLASRLLEHVQEEELRNMKQAEGQGNSLQRDISFYHYVLSREIRNVQKDISASPPKKYHWGEWEYYLKLMGNQGDGKKFTGQEIPDMLAPEPLRASKPLFPTDFTGSPTEKGTSNGSYEVNKDAQTHHDDDNDHVAGSPFTTTQDFAARSPVEGSPATMDGVVDRDTELRKIRELKVHGTGGDGDNVPHHEKHHRLQHHQNTEIDEDPLRDWSWLSDKSPLMSTKTEAEWILERLSAALERELNRQRRGFKRQPPIGMMDMQRKISTIDSRDRA